MFVWLGLLRLETCNIDDVRRALRNMVVGITAMAVHDRGHHRAGKIASMDGRCCSADLEFHDALIAEVRAIAFCTG